MNEFVAAHEGDVMGVLEGFDRVVFRGTLSSIAYPQGMGAFIGSLKVLYKDYGRFAQDLSERLKAHARAVARRQGRPFEYVAAPSASKEQIARRIARRDGIEQGLICVLSCVEPCRTISVRRDRRSRRLELVSQERRCLHLYFYYQDRTLGFMHVRLQTWLPMPIQVCVNGREYLARRMTRAGIGHERRENCFARIDDLPRAQEMIDELERLNWPRVLDGFAKRANALLGDGKLRLRGYYWTIRESEYATDVMFKNAARLKAVYPHLVDHAMKRLDSRQVMRFLERRSNCRFDGEVTSDIRVRSEGMRIKHRVEENSIKMYDKQGSVLRVETTINNPKRLRVWRRVRRKGRPTMAWVAMRKGVADTRRRAASCRAANGRYLQALAAASPPPRPVHRTLDRVSDRVRDEKDRWHRALRPVAPADAKLLAAVACGSFLLAGFSNRQLRQKLGMCEPRDPSERRRQAGAVGRMLALMRAHGLITRIPQTRRWRVTSQGRHVITVSQRVRDADVTALAA